jgi:hypothetical protein
MLKGDANNACTSTERAAVLMAALSTNWTLGWVVGAVVILLVAVLLLAIIGFARKIDGVAKDLVTDLDAIAQSTEPLQAVGATNNAVHTITSCLRKARGEAPAVDRYSTSPGWREST